MNPRSDDEGNLLQITRMKLLHDRESESFTIDGSHIRSTIARLIATGLFDTVGEEAAERVARRLEEEVVIEVGRPEIVDSKDWRPWLDAARARIEPYYWERYKHLLIAKGLQPNVVARLSEVTDQILDRLHDPLDAAPWDRRGLVMGHVQSGKTANYIGLMAKAADAGFRVVIVIAGVHNNLRNQTQDRIDEGFIGFSRIGNQSTGLGGLHAVGVGLVDASRRPSHFTTSRRDFSSATAEAVGVQLSSLNEPAVFVIKKNPRTLQNLIDWLKSHNKQSANSLIEAPLLLIDDEADNASINIAAQQDEVARINGQIRELLSLFSHSAYVAYTATPFANIFIAPALEGLTERNEDLFPRSFIVSLDSPTDYMGPSDVFLEENERLLVEADDYEDALPLRHKISLRVEELPASLVDAIRCFILARAVRVVRGQGFEHSSMLVNASRFVGVQGQLRDLIKQQLDSTVNAIRVHGALEPADALLDPEMQSLRTVWESLYPDLGYTWDEIQPVLLEAAAPISVVEINSQSSGALDYDAYKDVGRQVIVVGGLALSRGLTLEGLCVTYFLRNSAMYDTLLQMGRWFGYRPGYGDLVRIWMPAEANTWYTFIAEAVEELRNELRHMNRLGLTPADFGLKVRRHPAALMVTARNKMGSAENFKVEIGLSEELIETAQLVSAHREHNLRNLQGTLNLLASDYANACEPLTIGSLYRHIPQGVVTDFLKGFRSDPLVNAADPNLAVTYIESREGELQEWDILVRSKGGAKTALNYAADLGRMGAIERTVSEVDGATVLMSKHRLGDVNDERQGLSDVEIARAEEAYCLDNPGKDRKKTPGKYYRRQRKRPLLILYAVSCRLSSMAPIPSGGGLWSAWAISFPCTSLPQSHVEYVVNRQWLEDRFGSFDSDTDDLED